jgi:hypothetical protein
MMKLTSQIRWAALALVVLAMLVLCDAAVGQIQWRISIKLIADSGGNPPPDGFRDGFTIISNEVRLANQLLATYGRGYQFRMTEILTLTGVSQWYNIGARNNSNKLALQAAARANPALYALRDNAINVYVVNSSSGVCSFASDGDDIILVGANAYRTLVFHECGHFFDLIHTHEGEDFRNADNSSCTNLCACAMFIAGEADRTDETAPDNECYTSLDDIARGAFGAPFASLSASQRTRVNNSYRNIMSYHDQGILDLLTPDQLDRATDASNGSRFNIATGRTRFVDRNAGCFAPDGHSRCDFFGGGPFGDLSGGLNAADPGDIVLIRPGNFNGAITIDKAVTLRATRGTAVIGKP